MSFITAAELNTHIYEDTVEVISRGDEVILQEAIDGAVAQAESYLSKYDTTVLFARTGNERDKNLMITIKDIARWTFLALANPNIDLELSERRYKGALGWLKDIQSGKAVPANWPYKTIDSEGNNPSSNIKYGSNPKRNNHF